MYKLQSLACDKLNTGNIIIRNLPFFISQGGLLHNYHRPCVRIDPEGRCAAMLIYGSDLAILPFRQGEELDVVAEPTTPTVPASSSPSSEGFGRGDILPSFTVSLRGLSEVVNNVKDFQFLCGYNNPTVFILYEATPTWAGSVFSIIILYTACSADIEIFTRRKFSPPAFIGKDFIALIFVLVLCSLRRIALRRDTTSAIGLSLNMSTQSSDVIWHCHSLPFDASYCLAVPRPIGKFLQTT